MVAAAIVQPLGKYLELHLIMYFGLDDFLRARLCVRVHSWTVACTGAGPDAESHRSCVHAHTVIHMHVGCTRMSYAYAWEDASTIRNKWIHRVQYYYQYIYIYIYIYKCPHCRSAAPNVSDCQRRHRPHLQDFSYYLGSSRMWCLRMWCLIITALWPHIR